MPSFTDSEIAVLESSTQRVGVFFRLASTPVLRLWLGVGDIEPGADAEDPGGEVYRGFGALTDVPVFNQVINGRAERITVGVSGVTDEMVAAFLTGDVDAVKYAAAIIGIGIMDGQWRLLGSVHWLWRGRVDFPEFSEEAGGGPDEPGVRSIGLSIGGLMTGRRRAGLAFWTDQDQRRLYPDDAFCERTVTMSEIEKGWPKL